MRSSLGTSALVGQAGGQEPDVDPAGRSNRHSRVDSDSLEHPSALLFSSLISTLDHGTISIGSLRGGTEPIWTFVGAGQWLASEDSLKDHHRPFLGSLNRAMGDALDEVTALFAGHGRETAEDWHRFTPVPEPSAIFWGGAMGMVSLMSARRLRRREA